MCNGLNFNLRTIMKFFLAFILVAAPSVSIALAQSASSDPVKIGDVTVSGSVRTRIESWDFFQGNANKD